MKNKVLVVVDFQEKLMPVMENKEKLEDKVVRLIKGAGVLNLPILVTQQYTKGIGETIPAVKEALDEAAPGWEFYDKTNFSVMGVPEFVEKLESLGDVEIILCGIEAHICVQQSALQMLEKGYKVYVIEDCVGSRNENDKNVSVRRMEKEGATITTCESILFEMIGGAKVEGFKQISAIIK